MDNPIQVESLRKSYGALEAVKSIDFEVRAGEVFGLLGPNGALPTWQDAETVTLGEGRTNLSVTSRRPARTVVEMVKWLDENGLELADIRIKRPSLEDAFIELTGKSLRE